MWRWPPPGCFFGERRGFARSLEKALWYTAFFLSLWCTAYCLRAQELDFRYMCPAFALAGGWTFWCDRREPHHRPLRRLLVLAGLAARHNGVTCLSCAPR